jgi:hypothetical protein
MHARIVPEFEDHAVGKKQQNKLDLGTPVVALRFFLAVLSSFSREAI